MAQFEKPHAECAENAENIGLALSELSGLSVKLTHYQKKRITDLFGLGTYLYTFTAIT